MEIPPPKRWGAYELEWVSLKKLMGLVPISYAVKESNRTGRALGAGRSILEPPICILMSMHQAWLRLRVES